MTEPATVACVFRTGGIYDRPWVWALKRGLDRHLSGFRFVCLTDNGRVESHWRSPLKKRWPGWWSKMELFEPGRFTGPTVYLDLDTLPVGDLSEIAAYSGRFAMCRDFFRPEQGQSCVMAWTPGPESELLWREFTADPKGNMARFQGDQDFINHHIPEAVRLQDVFPGQIAGFKIRGRHIIPGPPKNARLVAAHGEPRFTDWRAEWAHEMWSSLATNPEEAESAG